MPPPAAGQPPRCRLCCSARVRWFSRVHGRDFARCEDCALVVVPSEQHVSEEEERERYALHDNAMSNPGYLAYLEAVAREVKDLPVLNPSVLDFGSGPARALESILRAKSILCRSYDPLYGIGGEHLRSLFDVVVANEVLEHVREPRKEVRRMAALLRPGGCALVRTLFYPPDGFSDWWYAQDVTHVNFFHERTMQHVAELMGGRILSTDHRQSTVIAAAAGEGE